MIIFETGIRTENGVYIPFISSADKEVVNNHIKLMGVVIPDHCEIMFFTKHYHLVDTTPHIINRQKT